jgi:hypothetical protein
MAVRLPRPLARREVLYGPDTPRERLVELANAYLERDLVFDAADFFVQARDRDGLEIIKNRARDAGDAFLLRQVQTAVPDLVSRSDWEALAARAREIGKGIYAERAGAGGAPPPPPLQEEEALQGVEEGTGESLDKNRKKATGDDSASHRGRKRTE